MNVKALALTSSVVFGMIVFFTTIWLIFRNYTGEIIIFEMLYPGYTISPAGSIIGLFYGMLDGLILGAIFGWLYNYLNKTSDVKKID
jgi:hypothetical protein